MHPLVAKTLELALAEVGTREVPLGSNRGRRVEFYLRSCGLGPGNPWCAAFVYAMAHSAAESLSLVNPYLRSGFCPHIAGWAKDEGILSAQPVPGATFLAYGRVGKVFRARHTGFVTAVSGDGVFSTVEGNSNAAGSREGIGVFRLKRTVGARYKFVHWERLIPAEKVAVYRLLMGGKVVAEMPIQQNRALCPVRSFGDALGFQTNWSQEHQAVIFNQQGQLQGRELAVQISLIQGVAHAPIRELVEEVGLQLRVNPQARMVEVFRG